MFFLGILSVLAPGKKNHFFPGATFVQLMPKFTPRIPKVLTNQGVNPGKFPLPLRLFPDPRGVVKTQKGERNPTQPI